MRGKLYASHQKNYILLLQILYNQVVSWYTELTLLIREHAIVNQQPLSVPVANQCLFGICNQRKKVSLQIRITISCSDQAFRLTRNNRFLKLMKKC